MKRGFIAKILPAVIALVITTSLTTIKAGEKEQFLWKANVASINITPDTQVWMAGYSARTTPSDGVLHNIWAKALVLEDASGHRSLLITSDILGVPKDFSDKIRKWIGDKYGLDYSQIILSTSHTHSGPVISRALEYIYPMDEQDWVAVDEYTEILRKKLLALVDEVMINLQPVKIYTQNGISRFQVNRRKNSENSVLAATELKGPNDYAVPVIKIETEDNHLLAIVFGYACHPTTLLINKFSGDYPGFAQIELEKLYSGTTAMFFQGAGADQNPIPRRTTPLAKQYGKELAAAVERVLSEDMKPQESKLITKYSEVDIFLDDPMTVEELREMSERDDYYGRWALGILKELQLNGSLISSYPFPIGYWQIGEQKLFILGGEAVIKYSLRLKEIFGNDIFVMSYANDVMGYIPDEVILKEGGYEGNTSQRVYGLPSKWKESIENIIIQECQRVATY